MVRLLNISLLLIIVVGVYFAAQARSEFEATRREYARLTAKVGRLPITDPAKVHVLAIETDDPLDFAWHMYVPAQFNWKWEAAQSQSGISRSSGTSREPHIEIVRVRYRKIDGQWQLWTKLINGSGLRSMPSLSLLDQPELLEVQRLGVGEVEVIEPDEVATLLSISAKQSASTEDTPTPAFVLRFGAEAAWKKPQIGATSP